MLSVTRLERLKLATVVPAPSATTLLLLPPPPPHITASSTAAPFCCRCCHRGICAPCSVSSNGLSDSGSGSGRKVKEAFIEAALASYTIETYE